MSQPNRPQHRQSYTRGPILVPLKGGIVFHKGQILQKEPGAYFEPSRVPTATAIIGGWVTENYDTTGQVDGAVWGLMVPGKSGPWKNSAGADQITAAHLLQPFFVADDDQLSLTDQLGTLPRGGIIWAVNDDGTVDGDFDVIEG